MALNTKQSAVRTHIELQLVGILTITKFTSVSLVYKDWQHIQGKIGTDQAEIV